ncbi:hypothetical protein ACEPAI_3174 [Sanghuangporus weigelae]
MPILKLDPHSQQFFFARSEAGPIDPELELLFAETILDKYIDVAFATLLVYHSVLTMNDEMKYFWSNPCSSTSLVYFTNHLVGLLAAIFNLAYDGIEETPISITYWISAVADSAIFVIIDYILAIRVLALYDQNRKMRICLMSLLGAEALLGLATLIYSVWKEQSTAFSITGKFSVCALGSNPSFLMNLTSNLIPMVYGLLLLVLAIYKAIEFWKLSPGFKDFRLVRVLVKDQVLYYGSVMLICILKIADLPLTDSSPFVSEIMEVAGNTIFLSVLGGQLLINLKEAGQDGVSDRTSGILSEIEFSQS